MTNIDHFDIVIIGAGPGGAAAAVYLAEAGLSVALLDKASFPREKTCGDGLTPRALGVLQELGLLDQVQTAGCLMDEATVFAPNGEGVTTRMPVRGDVPSIMMAIPRYELDHMIVQRAVAAGAALREKFNVKRIDQQAAGVTVSGQYAGRPAQISGRLAIVAVGASMGLLKRLGILTETPLLTLAARTYYENISALSGRFEFYFEGIPLPGYGWVFPLSDTTANIGAGVFERRGRRSQPSAQAVLEQFLQTDRMREMLAGARAAGPVRGYPIRTDFARARSHAQNILLVGEAAGLVNPLTGEGIDYALESGKIAAQHIKEMFAQSDFSDGRLAAYDRHLRHHFHEQVLFCERIRDWYLHRPIINRLVRVAQRQDHIRELFTDVVLGNVAAREATRPKTVWQIVFG